MEWCGWAWHGVPRVAINQLKITLEVIYILQQQSGNSSSGKHNSGTETETKKLNNAGKM